MYILKNSMKNIYRNKSRNILIGIIILGIIVSTVVAFSINTTTDEIIKDYKERFGSEVTIAPDMEKLMEEVKKTGKKLENISADKYLKFAESQYIKNSVLTSEFGAVSKTLKSIDEDVEHENKSASKSMSNGENENNSIGMAVAGADGEVMTTMPKIKVLGTSTLESLEEFNTGKRKIIDGEIYKEKDECVVSKEFAELNNIKVGDLIEINQNSDENSESYKLKVSGIYFDTTDEYGGMAFKSVYTNKRNEVLTSLETIKGISGSEKLSVQAKYYLKNPDMLKDFEKEIRANGLPEVYNVSTDEASYNKIVGPVEGLGSITLMFIFVVLGLGSVILILLNTLSIKERKYEIGVLRAIGMKKNKVAMGLIGESLIITTICLVIGIGAGSVLSQPVSNSLLQKQIEAQKSSNNANGQGGMVFSVGAVTDSSSEDTISEIDVTLNGKAIAQVTGVALLIVLVSSVVGVSYITKYEPRKILTERG
ncbi:MAG: ABC transporter permease [Clostridium sp.]